MQRYRLIGAAGRSDENLDTPALPGGADTKVARHLIGRHRRPSPREGPKRCPVLVLKTTPGVFLNQLFFAARRAIFLSTKRSVNAEIVSNGLTPSALGMMEP